MGRGLARRSDSRGRAAALLTVALAFLGSARLDAQVRVVRSLTGPVGGTQVEFVEAVRIGSLDGAHDSFGRVMSAALDRRGRVFVADDQNATVVAFDSSGRFISRLAPKGRGPGEVERPWFVTTDGQDSIFVWDAALARLSVFSPDLRFVRSVRLPSSWNLTSIAFLPSGEMLVAAVGGGDRYGIHVADRDGSIRHALIAVDRSQNLAGFESSLLGGSLDVMGMSTVYSRKSPYELTFLDGTEVIGRCVGPPSMTTKPEDVVEPHPSGGVWLRWQNFTHASNVLWIDSGLVANVILDPSKDERTVDLVDPECRLVRRTRLAAPITFVDRAGQRILGVSNVEYPEVIVFKVEVTRTR